MPSKARLLAKSMIESPILSEITSNPSVTPATITSAVDEASVGDFASPDLLPNTGNEIGDQAFVQSSNRLYIWNGSGWYNIALINTTPTWDSGGQPLSLYELDADSPQDVTVITLAASDPEGLPISYSYVTSGSMDSMATISQDSSVFTITPKTVAQVGEGVELTGSITFRASDGVNILPSVSSFTLSFVFLIENSKYTTLLVTATGTGDNNDITDSSTNNHTITVNGDAHAGTFSPYRHGGYSLGFGGSTGDYLQLPANAGFSFGTGDFTVEAWVYYPQFSNTNGKTLFDARPTSTNGSYWIMSATSANIMTFTTMTSGGTTVSDTVARNNQWVHYAAVREGTSLKLFANGTLVDQTTDSSNMSSSGLRVGGNAYQGSAPDVLSWNGYIADARIVKGTAVYTSAFTPPTLTERPTAITNTTLLIGHLPYVEDGSSSSHSITVNGSVGPKPFSPYDYSEYSESTNGGSVYFDGSGDSLNTTATQVVPTTSFTVAAWVYLMDTTDGGVWAQGTSGHVGRTGVSISVGKWYAQIGNSVIGTSTSVRALKWYYTELQWDGSTLEFFVDGSSLGSVSASNTPTNSAFYIGDLGSAWSTTYHLNGYVADVRVVSGTPSGSSTVPTAPLTAVTNTSLLVSGTDASIIDKSQTNNLKLFGNTTGSTTQVKFADTKSMYFDGSGDRMIVPADTSLNFGTGDFTIEFWINFSALPSNGYIINKEDGSGNDFTTQYYQGAIKASNASQASPPTWSHYTSGIGGISVNTWYHIAYVRSSGTLKSYKDGVEIDSATDNRNYNINNAITIGSRYPGDYAANFYIQDLRFTKGLARYTANFTPPTEPLKG